MNVYGFENPVFCVYAIAAALMIAKMMGHAWITVYWMMKTRSGFRLPEDLRRTPLNPEPRPDQLEVHPTVDRWRRIHQNELENVPPFLAVGLLYVATRPSLGVAAVLLGGYALSRFVHLYVVATGGTHDARASAWTVGSMLVYVMAGLVIASGARGLM